MALLGHVVRSSFLSPEAVCGFSRVASHAARTFANAAAAPGSSSAAPASEPEPAYSGPPKLVVFGGRGFVGSAVCKEALKTGVHVVAISPSGTPPTHREPWTKEVEWLRGNALEPQTYRHVLPGSLAAISCIGGFGSQSEMLKVNGTANAVAIECAKDANIPRFVYISAHMPPIPGLELVLSGYINGKKQAEEQVFRSFPEGGVVLRPWVIYGDRAVSAHVSLPLGTLFSPIEYAIKHIPNAKQLAQLPIVGPSFTPPVSVDQVAKVAVAAATDPSVPAGIIDDWKISDWKHPLNLACGIHYYRSSGSILCRSQQLDSEELSQLLGQSYLRPDFEEYTDEHVNDLVDAAASLISVIDDLRPLDPKSFNAAYEIWKAIAAVPPADRVRILDELEPGAVFTLWKQSVGRYVWNKARGEELFSDFSIWNDFPSQPGEVFVYEGLCEQFTYEKPANPLGVDASMQSKYPRAVPWLKPSPVAMAAPQERFEQHFFQANRTGLLHSRMVLSLPPPFNALNFLTPAVYNRVEIGITLVPNQADAGADACITYPADPALLKQQQVAGVALNKEDLPNPSWPKPSLQPSWSPLSFTGRDYIRAAGPGFYVGCAYRTDEKGNYLEEEHVYFALVMKY